jgi:hypothetical protein
MPKYTDVDISFSSGDTITSSNWNNYFGSSGNIQYAYDEYINISSGNAVTMTNSAVAVADQNEVHRFISFTGTRGDEDYADKTYGTLSSPVYKGYVWISATIQHSETSAADSNQPTFYLMIIPVSNSLAGVTPSSTFAIKQGFSTNNAQGSTITSWGLWPIVQTATISTIYLVSDGFTKFQVGIYRTDAAMISAEAFKCIEFSILPLGDVSGLVNVLERLEVVE